MAMWVLRDFAGDEIWRAFGIAALAALWTSHASLVVKSRRPSDAQLLKILGTVSMAALGIDASVGILGLVGALQDAYSEGLARALGALLVLTLLTTALPPLLRRAGGRTAQPEAAPTVKQELAASVERLSAMDLPVGARVELVNLRELVRRA
jgi:hypothetical protein